MFDTIVWATDGSDAATRALPVARDLARATGARLVAVHCRETMLGPGGGVPITVDDERIVADLRDRLAALAADGIETDLQVVRALVPHAGEAIAQAARDVGADVIVVGTRGHSPLVGAVLGSTTQRLLHIAPCSVLAVPARLEAPLTAA